MNYLLDVENRTIISSFVWTKQENATDGQTDRSALDITAVCVASNADALWKKTSHSRMHEAWRSSAVWSSERSVAAID